MKNHNRDSADCSAETKAAFYWDHLNEIYCAYSHLAERTSELTGNEHFEDWNTAINELIKRSENQLERLGQVYRTLGQEPSFIQCKGLTQFLEETFSRIQPVHLSRNLRRSYLVSYLQYTSGILTASFELLQLAGDTAFNNKEAHLLISDLLVLAQNENAILSVLD